MRPAGKPAYLEARRQQAIKLLEQGLSPVEVSRIIGVDRRSVRRWKSSYRHKGAVTIKARPNAGRPARLDADNHKLLNRYLLKGAMKAGFSTDLWTCPRIAQLINAQFGVWDRSKTHQAKKVLLLTSKFNRLPIDNLPPYVHRN